MDMWTSVSGSHYLVVNYYGITPDPQFKMWSATLDLIPFYGGAFAYVINCVVRTAIERHTLNNPSIIHAGNVSDQGANIRLAGVLLTSESDQLNCFNHNLNLVFEDVFGSSISACRSVVQVFKDLKVFSDQSYI